MSRRRFGGRDYKEAPANNKANANGSGAVAQWTCRNCARPRTDQAHAFPCCRYEACSTCWVQWLNSNLSEHKVTNINCIGCSHKLTDAELRTLMSSRTSTGAAVLAKYERVSYLRAVADMPDFLPCPTRKCNGGGFVTARCPTDSKEPFRCRECNKAIAVSPETLAVAAAAAAAGVSVLGAAGGGAVGKSGAGKPLVALLGKAASDAAESEKWKTAHSQQCPECRVHTEKNGGCPHMKCWRCGHDYCWYCRGPYYTGGSHSSCDPAYQSGGRRRAAHVPESRCARAMPVVTALLIVTAIVAGVVATVKCGLWVALTTLYQYVLLVWVLGCDFQSFILLLGYIFYPLLMAFAWMLGAIACHTWAGHVAARIVYGRNHYKRVEALPNAIRHPDRGWFDYSALLWWPALTYLWYVLLFSGTGEAGAREVAELAAYFAADGRPPVNAFMTQPQTWYWCRRFGAMTLLFVVTGTCVLFSDIRRAVAFWPALLSPRGAKERVAAAARNVRRRLHRVARAVKRGGRAVAATCGSLCGCCTTRRNTGIANGGNGKRKVK